MLQQQRRQVWRLRRRKYLHQVNQLRRTERLQRGCKAQMPRRTFRQPTVSSTHVSFSGWEAYSALQGAKGAHLRSCFQSGTGSRRQPLTNILRYSQDELDELECHLYDEIMPSYSGESLIRSRGAQ